MISQFESDMQTNSSALPRQIISQVSDMTFKAEAEAKAKAGFKNCKSHTLRKDTRDRKGRKQDRTGYKPVRQHKRKRDSSTVLKCAMCNEEKQLQSFSEKYPES